MKKNQLIAFIATIMMALAFSMSAKAQDALGNAQAFGNQKFFGNQKAFGNQQRSNQQGQERRGFHRHGDCLSDSKFSVLYNKVKNASFDDRKFDLIEVASLGCYYSCQQVAKIINLFSFSDKKMKALQMMASHIVDPQNTADIYKQFTFSSDKDKAAEIIRYSGR